MIEILGLGLIFLDIRIGLVSLKFEFRITLYYFSSLAKMGEGGCLNE